MFLRPTEDKPEPRKMGYWETDQHPSMFDEAKNARAKEAARQEVLSKVGHLNADEMEAVLAYMNAGTAFEHWMGWAGCRLCGEKLGTRCMLTPDGKWQFPEKWQHYITGHSVEPSGAFVYSAIEWCKTQDEKLVRALAKGYLVDE